MKCSSDVEYFNDSIDQVSHPVHTRCPTTFPADNVSLCLWGAGAALQHAVPFAYLPLWSLSLNSLNEPSGCKEVHLIPAPAGTHERCRARLRDTGVLTFWERAYAASIYSF